MSDIKIALDHIIVKREDYKRAEAYYEGDEAEIFASRRWHRLFKNDRVDFKFNFVRTVVDSVLNRLELASVTATTDEANAILNSVMEQDDFEIDANEIHKNALIFGDSYVIVWPDETGNVLINYNTPLTTAVIYDPENPRKKSYAAKLWQSYDNLGRELIKLNLYYADRIEKYEVMGSLDNMATVPNFTLLETIQNPWGEIPVFHFRTTKQYGRPEHADAIGPQDAINKLIATHMHTVDYQGAPQRYALSLGGNDAEFDDFDNDATARENMDALKNGPGELWYLKGVQSVGQFPAADPKVFTDPVKDFVRSMASITSTPLHYFEKTGNVPSGEALRTAEGPLMKKVEDRQVSFGNTWRDLFRFMLIVEGSPSDVEIEWQNVETMDSLDAWEVAIKKRLVGVSLKQVLIEMGYDIEIADKIVSEGDIQENLNRGMNSTNVLRQQGVNI